MDGRYNQPGQRRPSNDPAQNNGYTDPSQYGPPPQVRRPDPTQYGQPPRIVQPGQNPPRPAPRNVQPGQMPPRPVQRNVQPGQNPPRPAPRNTQSGPVPYRPREADARRSRPRQSPSYYQSGKPIGSLNSNRRRRHPTPFLLIIVIFILLLLIVIISSKSCRKMLDGKGSSETGGGSGTYESGNKSDGAESTNPPESTADETTDDGGAAVGPSDDFIIYIDPGHGFADPGASSDYLGAYHECDITLMVAKEVVSILQSKGFNARLSHDGVNFPRASTDNGDDIFSALAASGLERCTYVNENGADLFVSLHCDSYQSEDVGGTRIHYCGDYDQSADASDMTDMLARSIGEAFLGQRSVSTYAENGADAYNVTRFVTAPSALIEMGFVTNKEDAESLLDAEWRTKMATGIANGIAAFAADYMQ